MQPDVETLRQELEKAIKATPTDYKKITPTDYEKIMTAYHRYKDASDDMFETFQKFLLYTEYPIYHDIARLMVKIDGKCYIIS